MGKFKASFELVKMSFGIINKEKELLVYTILSGISTVLIILTFILGVFGISVITGSSLEASDATSQGLIDFVYMFILYFLLTFVALFFNTAIITTVDRVLKGEENKFMDGISSAFHNIGKIFIWTIISAFVTTILKMIQDRVPFIAKIVVSIVGAAWNIATIFAFPLMILGDRKASDAIKESPKLFISTWGENVIMNVGVGLFFMILFIGTFIALTLLTVFSFSLGMTFGVIMMIITAIILALIILTSITMDSVVRVVLYNYTQTKTMPVGVNQDNLDDMLKVVKKK